MDTSHVTAPTTTEHQASGNMHRNTAVKKIKTGLIDSNKTAQGRAFMFLWRLKGFDAVPDDYDEELKRSLKAYPPPEKAPGM